ncbi:MAG: 4Fe-4S dicluster domain-containing protein [Clostridiales Family XIII bacterium]|jgi:ferredoxin|nr:4Fe-4S dicluster domain-containing protein [Clostridiales Family XIII bacterium]
MDKNTKLIQKTALPDALAALLPDYRVFAPAGENERLAFTRIDAQNAFALCLSGTPLMPPKELLFPRSETLYGTDIKTGDVSLPQTAGPTAVFGVRPCDAHGIANLDCAFLEKGYVDSAYAARREALTLIVLACAQIPYETCFCDSMGGGPAGSEGADVLLTETEDGSALVAAFLTGKGRAVKALWAAAGLLSDTGADATTKSANPAKAPPPCNLRISKDKGLAAKIAAAFDDPMWARFSEACLGCGTCSFVCPTCYCFDLDSENRGGTAEEFRCWDCCMFSDYSRMAGGHNPRPTKKERLRNRYLHKLAYFDERYGRTLCVGCGRCIGKCPAGLDIAAVIEWGGTL